MNKSIPILSATLLVLSVHSAWAADGKIEKTGAGNMPQGEMKSGEMMDKDHMKKMHEHMDDMHKSKAMGDETCDMKSDGKCEAKAMKSENRTVPDKPKAATNADEHSQHH